MLITDQVILQNFTFQRVLDQLVARSAVSGLTGGQLYQQMLDMQNPKPGMFEAAAPHCDDFHTNGQPSFNGLPRRCPTADAALAAAPFGPTDYIPLAIVNRFDTMVDEGRSLNGSDGPRFGVAQMIETTYVPHRIEILRNFLNDGIPPVHSN